MKKVIIVESPTKAKTLSKMLGKEFKVLASKGHVVDLPEERFGISIKKGFKPYFEIIRGKKDIVDYLKKEAQDANLILLGSDPDREGEAIAYHISRILKRDDSKRVLFYEISKERVKEAIENPVEIDMNKVYSQFARRILDRIVGYSTSPLLWKVMKRGLSAGRVQTVALRLIVEREKERQKFVPEKYYEIEVIFEKDGKEFLGKLKEKLKEKDKAEEIKEKIQKIGKGIVKEIEEEEKEVFPLPPLKTSTLQQECSKRFGFSAERTMKIAQSLYEGKEIGEKVTGLITYMRTDSLRLSEYFINSSRKFIKENFGENYLPQKPNVFEKKEKFVQGAHEAIRPVNLELIPENIKEYLSEEEYKVYDLIYKRALASQGKSAVIQKKKVQIEVSEYLFESQGQKLLFDGFYKIISEKPKEVILPSLSKDEEIKILNINILEKETEPPSRYTEASLIKKLEELGIGRPSTYAPTIKTLFDREYIKRENKNLIPTELGMKTIEVLIPQFNEIFEYKFTAKMEEELDEIEEGKKEWREFLKEFYERFEREIEKFKEEMKSIKEKVEEKIEKKCPLCGKELVVKWSKYGKFVSCSGYPECKYKEKYGEIKCPVCKKGYLVKRKGKNGIFYGCSNYPDCEFTLTGEIIKEKCPECSFEIISKIKKNKKTFYFCPNCKKYLKIRRSK
ncbi:MAG: type I DNA topoisomerase [candidate division WOR-3 bacterium]